MLRYNVYSFIPATADKPPRETLHAAFDSENEADEYVSKKRETYGSGATLFVVNGTICSVRSGLHV